MPVPVLLVAGAGGRLCFPRLCMAFPVSFRREAMSYGGGTCQDVYDLARVRAPVASRPGSLLLTLSMSASCCMRSARVKGAWMSTGGSDCSIVLAETPRREALYKDF